MRASAVKTAIVDAIESITVDSNVGGESFRHVDLGGREPSALSERAFLVDLTGISRSIYIQPQTQRASYVVTVFYASYAGVEDRISDDAERIIVAMDTLPGSTGDLYATELDTVDVGASPNVDGMLEAIVPVSVIYRRTGV